jgi:hypothetical protein
VVQDAEAAAKGAEHRSHSLARQLEEAQAAVAIGERLNTDQRASAQQQATELDAQWAEAERALSNILKAANAGLRAVAAGKEGAKAAAEGRGGENGAAGLDRRTRVSGGRQWR